MPTVPRLGNPALYKYAGFSLLTSAENSERLQETKRGKILWSQFLHRIKSSEGNKENTTPKTNARNSIINVSREIIEYFKASDKGSRTR